MLNPQNADDLETAPRWMTLMLRLAAAYNLLWGAWVVLFPVASMTFCGYPPEIQSPVLWQCIGMIVGVYGVGYALAAKDPMRHWPIVLVGLLGKVFGPVGFVWAWATGQLPASAGWVHLTNDLIWIPLFVMVLWRAARVEQSRGAARAVPTLEAALATAKSQTGQSLLELSQQGPVLVVFLRHAGCTFCREALADLAATHSRISELGATLALVHLGAESTGDALTRPYGLQDIPRFSDADQQLYQAFELGLGKFSQLFGWTVLRRGMDAAWRHGFGGIQGNGFRLPGVFLLDRGRVVRAYRHATAADRPDYVELACPLPPA